MKTLHRKRLVGTVRKISALWERIVFRIAFVGRAPVDPRRLGRAGERRVALAYRLLGFRLLERNFEIGGGEIDLIVARGRLVSFVEVKTRTGSGWGAGWEAVGPEKRARLMRLAASWLDRNRDSFDDVRHEVVSVEWNGFSSRVERFSDAFRRDGLQRLDSRPGSRRRRSHPRP